MDGETHNCPKYIEEATAVGPVVNKTYNHHQGSGSIIAERRDVRKS